MNSSIKFSVCPEGPRSMQPVIEAQVYHSGDARDQVANYFHFRRGNNHPFLICEDVAMSQAVGEDFLSQFIVRNYKPDSDLWVLSVSGGDRRPNYEAFFIALRLLCDEHGIGIDFAPDGRHVAKSDDQSKMDLAGVPYQGI